MPRTNVWFFHIKTLLSEADEYSVMGNFFRRDGESGFTLIELLVVLSLMAVVLVSSAGTLRSFWFKQSLDGATEQVVSQLRQLQSRVTSESHPLVYGARFRPGSSEWGLIRYDPNEAGTADDTCTEYSPRTFDSGVFSAEVIISPAVTAVPDSDEAAICRTRLTTDDGAPFAVASSDVFVFFYARGTATAGVVRLEQPTSSQTKDVTITSLTGRVVRS